MAQREISQSRLFEWLTGDEDSRMCRDIPDAACREQPRNAFLHLLAALGNKLADELSSARLVLLGCSAPSVPRPGWSACWYRSGKPAPCCPSCSSPADPAASTPQMGLGHRRPLPGPVRCRPGTAGAVRARRNRWRLVLAALTVLSLARGLSSIATKDVMGKTIAKRQRVP